MHRSKRSLCNIHRHNQIEILGGTRKTTQDPAGLSCLEAGRLQNWIVCQPQLRSEQWSRIARSHPTARERKFSVKGMKCRGGSSRMLLLAHKELLSIMVHGVVNGEALHLAAKVVAV